MSTRIATSIYPIGICKLRFKPDYKVSHYDSAHILSTWGKYERCAGFGAGTFNKFISRAHSLCKEDLTLPQIPPTKGPWEGLENYRTQPPDLRWKWGENGAEEIHSKIEDCKIIPLAESLAACGRQILLTADPLKKIEATHAAFAAFTAGLLPLGVASAPAAPARPAAPQLVPADQVPKAQESDLPLSVYLLHNLAHVELNAVDLAWDTLVRFSHLHPSLPAEFFSDFLRVADDEARHLGWCLDRLAELDGGSGRFNYGCMPAHNLLWNSAQATQGDVAARLVLVPCVQEARGLDAGPRLVLRLRGHGDIRTAGIVEQISHEELAHVAVGVAWFSRICQELSLNAQTSFQSHVVELCPGGLLKGPFNYEARDTAGLQRQWYEPVSSPSPPPRKKRNKRGSARDRAIAETSSYEEERNSHQRIDVVSKRDKRKEERKMRKDLAAEAHRKLDLKLLHGRLASVLLIEATTSGTSPDLPRHEATPP